MPAITKATLEAKLTEQEKAQSARIAQLEATHQACVAEVEAKLEARLGAIQISSEAANASDLGADISGPGLMNDMQRALQESMRMQQDLAQRFLDQQDAAARLREEDQRRWNEMFRDRVANSRLEGDDVEDVPHRPTTGARVQAKSPPILDKDVDHKKFCQWKKTWDNYVKMVKLGYQSRGQQLAQFRSLCSPELQDKMIHAMGIPEDTPLSVAEVIGAIQSYLHQQRNVALDRLRLVNKKQQEVESFEDFYTNLCVAAEEASLRTMGYDDWMANHPRRGDPPKAIGQDSPTKCERNRDLVPGRRKGKTWPERS
eukprot:snap_masked-scaffold141_size315519-processed-gene-2.11 protein:Tk03990 transcript:snap_masked-scaffold141_size315519-processed-gene-2.11-mRNA-1 annotation:"hypothetical protein DAPPUDRAFT_258613"